MMRSKRLMERLAARGISAALIHKRVNMRYLSGYTGEGCLLVTDEGMTVFTDFRYIEQVSRQAPESRCVRTRNGQELHALVLEALGGRQSLAIEDDFLSHRDYCYFADHLPGVALQTNCGPVFHCPYAERRLWAAGSNRCKKAGEAHGLSRSFKAISCRRRQDCPQGFGNTDFSGREKRVIRKKRFLPLFSDRLQGHSTNAE